MAILHYQVLHIDHSWVISCEDVPIDLFDGRKNAVSAAMHLVKAARARGDQAVLDIRRHGTGHAPRAAAP